MSRDEGAGAGAGGQGQGQDLGDGGRMGRRLSVLLVREDNVVGCQRLVDN